MNHRGAQRHVLLSAGLIVLMAALAAFFVWGDAQEQDETVDLRGNNEARIVLTDDGFMPSEIRISGGTTVIFSTNLSNQFWPASNEHPTHSIFSEFDPKRPLQSSETWSLVFDRPGEWRFHDHIRSYYTGTIYVD